jgi:leucyl/phenylalanyl-tRNA--protein transferase
MPVYRLGSDYVFPPPERAEPSGLLAIGGDLEPERLLVGYAMGIFPWYSEGQPILWHSPDPRMVLFPADLKVSKSLKRTLKHTPYRVRFDTAFPEVMHRCAEVPRHDQEGTWIMPEMIEGYSRLHELGFAHSAESWEEERLVGGLYGVSLGGCFFGESMFALERDASKVAFVTLVRRLERWGFDLVDCQVHTEHLARLGAIEMRRDRFLEALRGSLARETRRGRWLSE